MSYRFSSMIAVIRNSLKTHKKNCSVPGNKICFQALSLFRSQGLISGFCLDINPEKRVWQGYPKYNIMLKYNTFNDPVIKSIKMFKNTKSNFFFFSVNKKIMDPLKKKRMFMISCKKGLMLLSVENFLQLYKNRKFKGRLIELLEKKKNFAQKAELKDYFCNQNTLFRNKKQSTTGLLHNKLDKKKNGYLYEIILFGLNYNAKRIKHQRRQFYVDLQKSHRILIDENIETPFKTRVFKRRLIVFGYDKTSLLNAVNLIKKNRPQNSYFGHGAIADFDKFKTKPGKVTQK